MKESQEQKYLFNWASLNPKINNYLFSIPNGGTRNKIEAYNLKLQGVKSGVPDIFLSIPSNGYHGLFIELKTKIGRLSKNQKIWIERLNDIGYKSIICIGWVDAKNNIIEYIYNN